MLLTRTIAVHTNSASVVSDKSYFHYGSTFLDNSPDFIKVADIEVTFDIDLFAMVPAQVAAITAQIDDARKDFHLKVANLEAARANLLCLEA